MTLEKPYKNMIGGLFDGTPLVYVGKPQSRRHTILVEIADSMAYTEGGARRDLLMQELWEQIGRRGKFHAQFRAFVEEKVAWARTEAKFFEDSASGTLGHKSSSVYSKSLNRSAEQAYEAVEKAWGDDGW